MQTSHWMDAPMGTHYDPEHGVYTGESFRRSHATITGAHFPHPAHAPGHPSQHEHDAASIAHSMLHHSGSYSHHQQHDPYSSAPPMHSSYPHDDFLRTPLPQHSHSPSNASFNAHAHSTYSTYPTLTYGNSPTRYIHSPLPSPLYPHDVHDDVASSSHIAQYEDAHHSHTHSHPQHLPSSTYNYFSTPLQSPFSPSRLAIPRQEDAPPHSAAPDSPVTVNPLQYHESRTSAATPRFAPAAYSQSTIASSHSSPAVQLSVSNTRSQYADDSEDEFSDDNHVPTDAYAALRAATSSSTTRAVTKSAASRAADEEHYAAKLKYENEPRTIYNPIPVVSRRTRNSLSAASNAVLDHFPKISTHKVTSYASSQHSPTGNSSSTASSLATDSSHTRPPSSHSSPATSEQDLDEEYTPARPPRPLVSAKLNNPVPVPHLTKKSRGRRVPTTPFVVQNGVSKNVRLHTCTVEGCGM